MSSIHSCTNYWHSSSSFSRNDVQESETKFEGNNDASNNSKRQVSVILVSVHQVLFYGFHDVKRQKSTKQARSKWIGKTVLLYRKYKLTAEQHWDHPRCQGPTNSVQWLSLSKILIAKPGVDFVADYENFENCTAPDLEANPGSKQTSLIQCNVVSARKTMKKSSQIFGRTKNSWNVLLHILSIYQAFVRIRMNGIVKRISWSKVLVMFHRESFLMVEKLSPSFT